MSYGITKYVNGKGVEKWQPEHDGYQLWTQGILFGKVWAIGRYSGLEPVLYRSKKRALRVARRREQKVMRKVFERS